MSDPPANTPDPLNAYVVGYPKIAGQMALIPETGIFRSFRALNARNLLYYQAELTVLEKQLLEIEDEDSRGEKTKRYALDWEWMVQLEDGEDKRQRDLVLKIRETVERYNRALVDQSIINRLKAPDKWDRKYLQHFLASQSMGPITLIGEDADTWGSMEEPDSYHHDLVTLKPREQQDPLSRILSENSVTSLLGKTCLKFREPKANGLEGFYDSSVQKLTAWISNGVASLIPVLSIALLSRVKSMQGKLGIIAVFSVLISACLSVLTNAKRSEVFAVTTAIAAVQVVFISADNVEA